MKCEKVSVIVAVYNIEQYICTCVDSILNQTYKELQIILVDDGSIDDSGILCDEYKKKDTRIQVIHQKNQGLSEARNSGLRLATGAWVAFVDGDDILHPDYILKLYDAVRNTKSDIAICQYKKITENEKIEMPDVCSKENVIWNRDSMLSNWHQNNKEIETVAWNKLYKRSLFEEGIRYPKDRLHEDVFVTHLLVNKADFIVIVQQELYFYLQRTNSIISSKISVKRIQDSIEAQKQRLSFFGKNKYPKARKKLQIGLLEHIVYYFGMLCLNRDMAMSDKKMAIDLLWSTFCQVITNEI